MPFAEIPFEGLVGGIGATLSTETLAPFSLNYMGKMTWEEKRYMPMDNFGTLVQVYRDARTDLRTKIAGSGPLDLDTFMFFLRAGVRGGVTATHPTSGILTWSHAANPTITSDNLEALTLIVGDPNVQLFEANYCMLDSLTIKADAGSDTGTVCDWDMTGQAPVTIVDYPDVLAAPLGPLLLPKDMHVWIDTSSAIGTTTISDRIISVTHKLTTGITRKKYLTNSALAPQTTQPTFVTHGRDKKGRQLETTIVFEFGDLNEYNHWINQDFLKIRVRHYGGPAIETVAGPITYYPYLQVDTYGRPSAPTWGEHEGSNRTFAITVKSEYSSGAGNDMGFLIINDQQTP